MQQSEHSNEPAISDAESAVMDVLWTKSPLTAEQVVVIVIAV